MHASDVEFLEVRRLNKAYILPSGSPLKVLDDFSCSFERNTFTLITGPNGEGKTVFADCLAGIQPFDSGQIVIDGVVLSRLDRRIARRHGIEYVPQSLPRPRQLTALELLALSAPERDLLYRPKALREQASEVIERFSLELGMEVLSRPVAYLPLAQLRRLYLARALMARSRVLLLDEPTAGLSAHEAKAFFATVRGAVQAEQGKQGLTVIAIAHPMQAALENAHTRYFTRRGLAEQQPIPRTVHAENTARNNSAWQLDGLDVPLPEPLAAGRIYSICGSMTREFEDFCVRLHDKVVQRKAMCKKIIGRVSLVTFDGIERRLVNSMSINENCLIDHLTRGSRWVRWAFFVDEESARKLLSKKIVAEVHLTHSGLHMPVSHLSGGNKQLLLISRELCGSVAIAFIANPFRGLDDNRIQAVTVLLRRMATMHHTCIVLFGTGTEVEKQVAHARWKFDGARVVVE